MYQCNCGRSFEKIKALNGHARFCKDYVKILKKVSKYKIESGYVCECGRCFEKHQSLNAHFSQCLIHRNGKPIIYKFGKSVKWNKGLTKETNETIARVSAQNSLKFKGRPGRKHTDEMKKHLSERRIAFLENNPDSGVKWYSVSNGIRDIKVQGLWEKNTADWLNQNSIKWDRVRISYDKVRTYTPDFKLIDLGYFIEVKGWLSDRDINKMNKVKQETGISIKLLTKLIYQKMVVDASFSLADLIDF